MFFLIIFDQTPIMLSLRLQADFDSSSCLMQYFQFLDFIGRYLKFKSCYINNNPEFKIGKVYKNHPTNSEKL